MKGSDAFVRGSLEMVVSISGGWGDEGLSTPRARKNLS